jgi:hypothetical protein
MDKNRLRFILVPQETHLFSLSKWLSRAETEGGLGCRIALNLSGDDSSGIAIKLSNKKPLTYFGEGSFPLPSALIIE